MQKNPNQIRVQYSSSCKVFHCPFASVTTTTPSFCLSNIFQSADLKLPLLPL